MSEHSPPPASIRSPEQKMPPPSAREASTDPRRRITSTLEILPSTRCFPRSGTKPDTARSQPVPAPKPRAPASPPPLSATRSVSALPDRSSGTRRTSIRPDSRTGNERRPSVFSFFFAKPALGLKRRQDLPGQTLRPLRQQRFGSRGFSVDGQPFYLPQSPLQPDPLDLVPQQAGVDLFLGRVPSLQKFPLAAQIPYPPTQLKPTPKRYTAKP